MKLGIDWCSFASNINSPSCNTCCEQHKRHLYTWTSPNRLHQNQIDYILSQNRWRSMLPGADCDSDHQLLIAWLKMKLKVMKKASRPVRYDLSKISQEYVVVVSNKFQTLAEAESLHELWENMKKIINDVANKHIPRAKWKKTSEFLSQYAMEIAHEG